MKQEPSMISLVEDYLTARRKMGFALGIAGEQLLAFARFADDAGHRGPLTAALTVRWAQSSPRATPLTWARRLEVLRPFAKYRSQFDAATEIVPRAFFGPAHRRLVPHIYYEEETVALLNVTDKLLPHGGLRTLTYRTLFGLVAATGLRISEALHLKPQDVDLGDSILKVRDEISQSAWCLCIRRPAADGAAPADETQQPRNRGVLVSDRGEPLADRPFMASPKLRADLGWVARGAIRLAFTTHAIPLSVSPLAPLPTSADRQRH
jgi:integrase